eukprot:TRINITY_DN14607_c0_g1_i1.p1 TRINITY_DN14607_c0_g1~~TRINITY_DN14607_c0_g1_i1.p1  ORF type:complete len:1548 (-),score=331.92 TRINITY_DN14607_c0_g1_i1:2152-6795(-)
MVVPTTDAAYDNSSSRLRAVCRVRPLNEQERGAGATPAVTASEDRAEVAVVRVQPNSQRQVRSTFRFDHVVTPLGSQNDLFAVTVRPLLQDVLTGYDAAALAYGQTGSGKTHTIEGDPESVVGSGLVTRSADALLQAINAGDYIASKITASCLEICGEELVDALLSAKASTHHGSAAAMRRLELRESNHGVVCSGITEIQVNSLDDVANFVKSVRERRRSSNSSHYVFTLQVSCRMRVLGGEVDTLGKLHLVDLAGSECSKRIDSLSTLSRVLADLRKNDGSRVIFRDSKLTWLLQDALGGSDRTVIIATISPAHTVVAETVSTLKFAEEAAGYSRPEAATSVNAVVGSSDLSAVEGLGVVWATRDRNVGGVASVRAVAEARNKETTVGYPSKGVAMSTAVGPALNSAKRVATVDASGVASASLFSTLQKGVAAVSGKSAGVAAANLSSASQKTGTASSATGVDTSAHFLTKKAAPWGTAVDPQKVIALSNSVTTSAARAEAAMLQKRLADLTQQADETRVMVGQKSRDAHDLSRRADDAEARHEAVKSQLEEMRRAAEERAFVLARTIEFADRRTAEATALAEALGTARARGAGLSERLAARGSASAAVRAQVRGLCCSVEESLHLSTASAEQPATKVVAESEEAYAAQMRAHEAMGGGVDELERVIVGLASSVHEASDAVGKVVAETSASAAEVVAADRASVSERLAKISAAVRSARSAGVEGHEQVLEIVGEGDRRLEEQEVTLQCDLRSGSQALVGVAKNIVSEIRSAHESATTGHENAACKFNDSVQAPIGQLCEQLDIIAAKAESHGNAASAAVARAASEMEVAAERRTRLGKAIVRVAEAHADAAGKELPELARSLAMLGETLTMRGSSVESLITSVANRLDAVQVDVADTAGSGEGAVCAVMGAAQDALSSGWEESRASLARLEASLRSGSGSGGGPSEIAQTLCGAVAALEEVRVVVCRDVTALRDQRCCEQRILGLLRQQRETIQTEVEQARSALSQATMDLEAAQAAVTTAERDQSTRREQLLNSMVATMEATLRREFDSLGDHLAGTDGLTPARIGVDAAQTQVASASAAAAVADQRACRTSADVVHLIESLNSEKEHLYNEVATAQEHSADACRNIETVATASIQSLAEEVRRLKVTQDAARSRWALARDGTKAAAAAWAEGGRRASRALSEAADEQALLRTDICEFRQEVSTHHGTAEQSAAEFASSGDRQQAMLSDISDLLATSNAEVSAVEACFHEGLGVLSKGLDGALSVATRCSAEARGIAEAADIHAAALGAVTQALFPALSSVGDRTAQLSDDVHATLEGAAECARRILTISTEIAERTCRSASDGAETVRHVANAAEQAIEAQHTASTAALASQETRWLDMQTFHRAKLQSIENAVSQATTEAETAASTGRARAIEESAHVQKVDLRRREAIHELLGNFSNELVKQLTQVREGVSLPPLAAFATEEDDLKSDRVFEDASAIEVHPAAAAALRNGLAPRPGESALVAEFRGERRQQKQIPPQQQQQVQPQQQQQQQKQRQQQQQQEQ